MTTTTRPRTAPAVDHLDDGRPVVWAGWVETACTRRRSQCTRCRHRGPHWVTYGRVDPTPGEVWTIAADGVRGPARPTLRLVAYQCPGCGHRRVIDLADWHDITPPAVRVEQPGLFDAPPTIPTQRRGSKRC